MPQGIANLFQDRIGFLHGSQGASATPEARGTGQSYGSSYGPGRDPRPGGGDPGMTYTRRIPSPILKRAVAGPPPPGRVTEWPPINFVYSDKLNKAEANKKFLDSMLYQRDQNLVDTSIGLTERLLQAFKVNEEDYGFVKGQVALSGATNEYGITQEIKKALGKRDIDISEVPLGTPVGGGVAIDKGPFRFGVSQDINDKKKYEASVQSDDLMGDIQYADNEVTGALSYSPENMFSLDTDYYNDDLQWRAALEGDKAGVEFAGVGPKLDEVQANIGSVSGEYYPDSKGWDIGINQSLTDSGNLRLKGNIGSDDSRNIGLYYSNTFGPSKRFVESYDQPTELEKILRKYETYSRGGILGAF